MPPTPPAPPGSRTGLLIGAAVAVLVAGAIAGWLLLRDPKPAAAPKPAVTVTSTVELTEAPTAAGATAAPATTSLTSTLRMPRAGTWVLVLDSLPKTTKTLADAEAVAGSLSSEIVPVEVIDSDLVPGLNPGYWAVVSLGYPSSASATSNCPDLGRTVGGDCYPRRIG